MTTQGFQQEVIDRLARIETRAESAASESKHNKISIDALRADVEVVKQKLEAQAPLLTSKGFLQFLGAIVLAAAGAAGAWVFAHFIK